jgi:dTDP-4-amino-4,6-dideoxygalactose transaminase
MMANHGQSVKYKHDEIGCNSRLDTIQAAILRVKLPYLDEYNRARNAAAAYYDKRLQHLSGLQIPARASWSNHVFHQYTVKIEHGKRDAVQKRLAEKQIPTMIYYPIPLHFQQAYKLDGFGPGSFPATELLSEQVLSLPIHTEMTPQIQDIICDALIEALI